MTIDVDTTAQFAAMDRCVSEIEKALLANSKVTADRIADGARQRARFGATGKTREGITVEKARKGDAYLVFVNRPEMPGLPGWLEFGTKHMAPRPFFFAPARLEEGSHDLRAREAVDDAIRASGLGE